AKKKSGGRSLLFIVFLALLVVAGGWWGATQRPEWIPQEVLSAIDLGTSGTVSAALPNDEAPEDTEPAVADSAPKAPEAPEFAAPSFDVVRVDAAGSALIAGRAPPEFDVAVEIDGTEVLRIPTDANGSFAAVFDLERLDVAQIVELVAYGDPGQEVRSIDTIILAPQSAARDTIDGQSVAADGLAPQSVSDSLASQSGSVAPDQAETEDIAALAEPTAVDMSSDPEDVGKRVATDAAAPALDPPQASSTPAAPVAELAPADNEELGQPNTESAPAILLASRDGIEVLQPAGDSAQVPISTPAVVLDSISYSATGAIMLSGRGPVRGDSAETVRIYLNNRQIADTPVEADGRFQVELAEIGIGVYTMRLDRLDAEGTVISRFETPFKREDPATLARFSDDVAIRPGVRGIAASAITVQPGVTLWSIASDRYGDGFAYVKVFEANQDQIRNPDLIYPGQVFALPD
ncbi:MAG: LysM peptidoglycan-binding domain-containing protein, partial [Pseudomonadota bacterium]